MDIKTLTSGALIKHPSHGLLLGTGPVSYTHLTLPTT